MKTVDTVAHLLKTNDGDIGGILLGNGDIIDTPKGHGDTLRAVLKKGDRIEVEGKHHLTRNGNVRLKARKITLKPRRQEEALARMQKAFA